jgi:DtxR family Mn-dependent transcriptional regulator
MRTKFGLRTEVLLRTVYSAIENDLLVVGPSFVAQSLNVSKSTAQKMLVELSEMGYGVYVPKKGLVLNDAGRREAVKAVRNHRLIECMLDEVGVREVCNEAEKIEMVAGEELMRALEEKYGDRKRCPCGKRIPEVTP